MNQGPEIRPLPETAHYDLTVTTKYITAVLDQFKQQDSYGLFAGVREYGGPVLPTLVFGFRKLNELEIVLPPTPYQLPLLVIQDWIALSDEFGAPWSLEPVQDADQISLEALSLGIEGGLVWAGSFGGFLKCTTSPQELFGITAAHCLPEAVNGTRVCCPSTIEVTGRLKRLLPHTTMCPPTNRLHLNLLWESEAQSILNRFRFQANDTGVSFVDRPNNYDIKTGLLSGEPVGEIVSYQLDSRKDLLYQYDRRLESLHLPNFSVARSWETTVDWCIFSCNGNRYGGNIYDGFTIDRTGYLYPGARVEKIGRSSRIRGGNVNRTLVQHWDDGHIIHDIAIIGIGGPFAVRGDSGGCVFVEENGIYYAAGILMAATRLGVIALASPLDIILDCAQSYEWASV